MEEPMDIDQLAELVAQALEVEDEPRDPVAFWSLLEQLAVEIVRDSEGQHHGPAKA